jgi:hypothetical protein
VLVNSEGQARIDNIFTISDDDTILIIPYQIYQQKVNSFRGFNSVSLRLTERINSSNDELGRANKKTSKHSEIMTKEIIADQLRKQRQQVSSQIYYPNLGAERFYLITEI